MKSARRTVGNNLPLLQEIRHQVNGFELIWLYRPKICHRCMCVQKSDVNEKCLLIQRSHPLVNSSAPVHPLFTLARLQPMHWLRSLSFPMLFLTDRSNSSLSLKWNKHLILSNGHSAPLTQAFGHVLRPYHFLSYLPCLKNICPNSPVFTGLVPSDKAHVIWKKEKYCQMGKKKTELGTRRADF